MLRAPGSLPHCLTHGGSSASSDPSEICHSPQAPRDPRVTTVWHAPGRARYGHARGLLLLVPKGSQTLNIRVPVPARFISLSRAARYLFGVCLVLLTQCARPPEPDQPPEPAPVEVEVPLAKAVRAPLGPIEASVEAYERGDRDAIFHHLGVLWRACGRTAATREALLVAISAELDPANSWPQFDRAAYFSAVFLGARGDRAWLGAMAEALETWARALGSQPSGAPDPPASPAGALQMAVRRESAPRQSDECALAANAKELEGPLKKVTTRTPSPSLVAQIVQLEHARLQVLGDHSRLRARADSLSREIERLRKLLDP